MKFLTSLLVILIVSGQISAQQIVEKKSLETAIKKLNEKTTVPLRLPTLFFSPQYFTAKERKQPLKAVVTSATTDSFELEYCFSGICQGSFYYGVISGEKITPETESPVFEQTVKLAQGIIGYYQAGSCGASCGHSWIFWDQDGYRYAVGLNVDDDIDPLTKFANSAINNRTFIESKKTGFVYPENKSNKKGK